jgi:hypothetical protein
MKEFCEHNLNDFCQNESIYQCGPIYDDFKLMYDMTFNENELINNQSLDYIEDVDDSKLKKNLFNCTETKLVQKKMERAKSVVRLKRIEEESFPKSSKWKSTQLLKKINLFKNH